MKKIKNLLVSGVLVLGAFCQTTFASPYLDVLEHDWYKMAVDYVSDQGLMSAATAGHFLPDYPITRGEFVSILGKMEEIDISYYQYSGFSEVASDDPQSPYIAWAVASGVVSGYSEGGFGQNDPITREQMSLMLSNYMNHCQNSVVFRDQVASFQDSDSISPWALPSAELMMSIGLMTGDSHGNFNPGQNITRGETAAMIMRLSQELDLVTDLLGTYVGTYTTPDGELGMMLNIRQEGTQYYADFSFYSEPNQYKNFDAQFVQNIYRSEGDSFVFRGDYWLFQGEQSQLFDLKGAKEGDIISGTILNLDSEESFSVKKPLG